MVDLPTFLAAAAGMLVAFGVAALLVKRHMRRRIDELVEAANPRMKVSLTLSPADQEESDDDRQRNQQ